MSSATDGGYNVPKKILRWNDVSVDTFTQAVRNVLEQGRGKFRNILIKGPAKTGKTFILNPLNVVFKAFSNPASSTFPWVGAEKAEVIFLTFDGMLKPSNGTIFC